MMQPQGLIFGLFHISNSSIFGLFHISNSSSDQAPLSILSLGTFSSSFYLGTRLLIKSSGSFLAGEIVANKSSNMLSFLASGAFKRSSKVSIVYSFCYSGFVRVLYQLGLSQSSTKSLSSSSEPSHPLVYSSYATFYSYCSLSFS